MKSARLTGVLFILSFFLIFSFGFAQNSPNVKLVGRTGGTYNAVAVQGNYAYIAEGGGLSILNISNSTSPQLVGTVALPASANSVTVNSTYAYVADSSSGLQIINVSNPASPTLVGSYATSSSEAYGVAVSGNYAYLATGSGLQIININNPFLPTLAGLYTTGYYYYNLVSGVAVSGNYAYVADSYYGLLIINISNPASPTLAGFFGTGASSIAVSGNYVYVADYYNGLQIINISNPASPTLAGSCGLQGDSHGIAVSGNYAYVVDDDTTGLQIINISNPSSPTLAGSYPMSSAYGVAVNGNYAYVADGDSGLQIINISNPVLSALAGSYASLGYYATGVTLNGNYAYVPGQEAGLQIVNISNPTLPILTGSYTTPSNAIGVAVSGDYAYVAEAEEYPTGLLQILNISNPSLPTLVDSYTPPDEVVGVAVSGNYAYVANEYLYIVNISTASSPTFIGAYTPSDNYAYVVAVSGNYVYMMDWNDGLDIINISTASSPTLEGFYSDKDIIATGIALNGNYAYLVDNLNNTSGKLEIINIGDPSLPTLAGSYTTADVAHGVAVSGDYAYVATDAGLQILNISDPAFPTLAGYYDTPGYAEGVAVNGNYVYLATEGSGLWIFQFPYAPAPTAGFYATPTVGEGPLTVDFWDESLYSPTSWSWDFGDGSTSSLQNPTHVYAHVTNPTSYTVQLIVSNSVGTSTAIYTNYITVNPSSPPNYTSLPSLKLFNNQSINNAFFMEQYNTGDAANSYSIFNNFNGLVTLNGSTVSQGAYGSATVGTNMFIISNSIGASTVSNEVKYSTYKIYKLPHVGLTVGSSWDVNVAGYTYNSTGLALPPSFGMVDSLSTDNPAIAASWLNNSTVHITATTTISSVANVYITASPNATAPLGNDVDVERIQVYTNLLANNTFSTANDTTAYGLQLAPGRSTMATQQWISSYTDSEGTQANGIWQFTFADTNGGVKSTPILSNWIDITDGQWYTFRIRLVADSTNNNHQAFLFGFTNFVGDGIQTDIAGNVLFGVPTIWTWQEAPLLAHGNSPNGYPQFQFKAGGAGSIYIDEIQILNAIPALLEARSNTRFHYLYGQFTTGNDTTGWGQQLYSGALNVPGISVNNGLVLNFAGASETLLEGIKWTANNESQGNVYSFPVNLNHDVNVGLTLSVPTDSFNSLSIVLVAAYGIQSVGQSVIGISPSNLIVAAGLGVLNSANYYAEGNAVNPYYQAQFGVRSDQAGFLVVSNVDVNVDNDDPNFGDANLFP
jgi:hypothetical protein